MTDKNSKQTTSQDQPKTASPPPKKASGGRGLAVFSLLIALAAGGASAYLWYLWDVQQKNQTAILESRLDQTLSQVAAERDTELQSLKTNLKDQQERIGALQGESQIHAADIQTLEGETQTQKGDIRALQGDIQTLKGAIETQKGAIEIQKSDTRTLQSDIRSLQQDIQGLQGSIQTLRTGLETQKGNAEVRQREILAIQDETQALKGNLQAVADKMASQHQAQESEIAQLNSQLENLQLGQRGLVNTLEAVKEVAAQGGDVNAFALSEVEYLLRLADHKLTLQQDVKAALEALTTAEQRLSKVDETAFLAVQRMIAEDIASLRGVELPDRSALAHKIVEMEQRVDELPLRTDIQMAKLKEKVKPPVGEGQISPEAEAPWWEQAGVAAWSQLKDIVIIRHERSSGPPLIAVEEEYFLIENLRLQMEAMRLALLRGDATNYQDSNELARKWLQTYFDTDDERVANILSELKALQTIQFNPYIPDISGTLKAFRDVMERRSPIRSAATPAVSTETGSEEAQP